jgi:hypothetical protein
MTFKTSTSLLFLFVVLTNSDFSQSNPAMRVEDRARIREVVNISKLYGDKIWSGINSVPFAIILVADTLEFLIHHPDPSNDFTLLGYDSLLGSKVYYRKAVFDKHFLATFPAVNGVNTIVVGTPENTGRSTSEWIVTLLHEHFHQYVNSTPGYFEAVNKLDLSGGDKTGMWMLNYPFPYSDSTVALQYALYTSTLSKTVSAIGSDSFRVQFAKYAARRKQLQILLKPADYRYFSFQIWQEGIARYTEYKFLELLDDYEPSQEVSKLPDFVSFKMYYRALTKNQSGRIAQWSLRDYQRDCFYALGFGEGLILDHLDSNWRTKYLIDRFYIEHYSDEFAK